MCPITLDFYCDDVLAQALLIVPEGLGEATEGAYVVTAQ